MDRVVFWDPRMGDGVRWCNFGVTAVGSVGNRADSETVTEAKNRAIDSSFIITLKFYWGI